MTARLLVCFGALALAVVGGYLVASSDQPSPDDAAAAYEEARKAEFAEAKHQAQKVGFKAGRGQGIVAGTKTGSKQGKARGTADGEAEAAARDAEAAQDSLVYCVLGANEYTTAEDCQQRSDTESYCGGPDSPEC